MNKISTLTLDFIMIDDTIDIQEGARSVRAGDHLEQCVFWTIRASTRGVEKLTVITPEAMSELRKSSDFERHQAPSAQAEDLQVTKLRSEIDGTISDTGSRSQVNQA
ncbi:uncharacterized protein RAG0_02353 [Rhynchosporium agropyri]|uniref:Uncharacterized protein n=1 Tax=Rhynchosporium agropyri TaxID=914238 RepID=A0A1E1K169_9HELO|nr:uncharacterized protein RAG0_02353 [Rhynchosporium agropyri]